MTPERIAEIRAVHYEKYWAAMPVHMVDELIAEIERLNAELIEARLTAEEAWCDQ